MGIIAEFKHFQVCPVSSVHPAVLGFAIYLHDNCISNKQFFLCVLCGSLCALCERKISRKGRKDRKEGRNCLARTDLKSTG